MCEISSFKNFENSLTTVKVITKTKVAPFYLGHGVDIVYVNNFGLGSHPPIGWTMRIHGVTLISHCVKFCSSVFDGFAR